MTFILECFFEHADRDVSFQVDGDDFTVMPTDSDINWYTAELEKVFKTKVRGRIGKRNLCTEVRILNCIVHIKPDGVRYAADPRHHELLIRSMGLEAGTSVPTPGVTRLKQKITSSLARRCNVLA